MKIYTKGGDKGYTSLVEGTRIPKSHLRLDAYGTVDELNSYMGVLRDYEEQTERQGLIIAIQNTLFIIGSRLASDPSKSSAKIPELQEAHIEQIEHAIDAMNEQLPLMRNFVLPGGHLHISFCHIARTVCRRAERIVYKLSEQEPVDERVIVFLNRLSDYLFTLARMVTHERKATEIPWKPEK